MKTLIIAELSAGKELRNSTLAAISFAATAAQLAGGSYDILVLGSEPQQAAETLAKFGAHEVLVSADPSFEHPLAEVFAPTVSEVGKEYQLLVATASSFGKDLMPRVAARLDAAYAGDCAAVTSASDQLVYKRPMFAGNAFGDCTLSTPIQVATVRQSEVEAAKETDSQSPIRQVAKSPDSPAAQRVEFVALDAVKSERPELTDARVIVSGGRALKDKFFDVLEPLADQLGAALGASRAAVDAGYCPGDFQVGQTGKIVAPELYFAVGISGAIQHIAGMKGSKVIVAINKDPDAPIFQLSDYGLVADLFDAVPELVSALKAG
ncbi:MAG: electron transfer flavoprotein subunit alpha/FixB family protein [Polyangiaceae bacterium]|nr:electron transfer flavoprotein subunit alpha/FixB family protein [Polyangiaceae bacterium]